MIQPKRKWTTNTWISIRKERLFLGTLTPNRSKQIHSTDDICTLQRAITSKFQQQDMNLPSESVSTSIRPLNIACSIVSGFAVNVAIVVWNKWPPTFNLIYCDGLPLIIVLWSPDIALVINIKCCRTPEISALLCLLLVRLCFVTISNHTHKTNHLFQCSNLLLPNTIIFGILFFFNLLIDSLQCLCSNSSIAKISWAFQISAQIVRLFFYSIPVDFDI